MNIKTLENSGLVIIKGFFCLYLTSFDETFKLF